MIKKIQSARIASTALIALLACIAVSGPARAQHAHMTPVLSAYLKMVFAGDVSGAAELFASAPDDQGSLMLVERFERRFTKRTDGLDLTRIESPVVHEIAELFQSYWLAALMQEAPLDVLDGRLKGQLNDVLTGHGFASALDDEDTLFENVEAFIRREGYFAQSGRTPNFATFGMASTGGWAKKDGLYCIRRHYDLDSEKFKLSFLKHEARHFADFGLYPELQPADLEYRGKLTELVYSEEGTYRLLTEFTKGANRVENAPHPLANWYVVEGLSRHLLGGQRPADSRAWESIPKEQIREAARRLLEEHDDMLADLGPRSATGVVNL